ncbi:MAG: hypothetical protein WC058_08070 [Phycisphaeraceae bacterium]
MALSQTHIDELIRCSKVVTEKPRRQMVEEHGHRRNDMKLTSEDGNQRFDVFLRQGQDFPENFSIGLRYAPGGGEPTICLLRCNGPHEGFAEPTDNVRHHTGCHIHRAKADNLEAGRAAEKGAERTTAYATFEDAILFFLKECNVKDAGDLFPDLPSKNLWDLES